jgi:hypothetical protein
MPKHVHPKKMQNRLVCGDSAKVLRKVPSDSVDLIVTDPPWAWSFMSKGWDKVLPPPEIWEECLRVLKPGAFAFVHCGPRQDCLARMIIQLEDVGFLCSFTPIFHVYGSGFPKAANLSKAADKAAGVEREVVGEDPEAARRNKTTSKFSGCYGEINDNESCPVTAPTTLEAKKLNGAFAGFQPKPSLEIILCVAKPLAPLTRSDVYAATGWDYYYTREIEVYPKNRKRLEKRFGRKFRPHKGEKKGDVIVSRLALNPALTDQVLLNGKKVLEEKPYRDAKLSNYLTQALVNGHGCTWLGDARIPTTEKLEGGAYCEGGRPSGLPGDVRTSKDAGMFGAGSRPQGQFKQPSGRFPANLLVSTRNGDPLDDGVVRKTGDLTGNNAPAGSADVYNGGYKDSVRWHQGDSGSFSRYFSLDQWWAERIRHLPPNIQKTFPFMIVPKASSAEKNRGLVDAVGQMDQGRREGFSNPFNRGGETRRNTHPTTKPVDLISYLVTLGSRKGDLVMDPFLGSGTTAIAVKLLGRKYFGIEREREYFEIAEARMRGNTWAGALLDPKKKAKRKKKRS